MVDILPCAKCGKAPEITQHAERSWGIVCRKCFCGTYNVSKEIIINGWNNIQKEKRKRRK